MQPEKWDSLTRSWRQNLCIFSDLNLMLIDEIHHLGDDRGSTLESIVVRMQLLHQLQQEKLVLSRKSSEEAIPLSW